MGKPKKCMHPNCNKCVYKDCIYGGLEYRDILEQDRFDKELEIVEPEILARRKSQRKYNQSEKGKDSQSRYNQSEKGKDKQRRYNDSDKGKAARKRYAMTEKGIENEKRKRQRKIDNGRNAEYCRRYYYKKKMEMQGA
jgi:hypothetical protein